MIWVGAGIKGGVGKSTIVANLAVIGASLGKSVVLVDSDNQQTSATWAAARTVNPAARYPVTTVTVIGTHIAAECRKLARAFDLVIVDAGARNTDSQRFALAAADLAVLPMPPRGPDLWTLGDMTAMLRDVRGMANPDLRAVVFVNRADAQGQDNAEAESAFAEFAADMHAAPCRVGNRKAIPAAHLAGLGAIETPYLNDKAAAELTALYWHLFDTAQAPGQHLTDTGATP